MQLRIAIKRLTPTAKIPAYATPGSAGADLHADLERAVIIAPGERAVIPTGLAVALPPGLAMLICPRSGLSAKAGITVHNGPGVIDGDYRDGVGVILHNTTHQQFVVNPDDRIAQMLLVPVATGIFEERGDLGTTERTGGFGSTGQ